MRSSPPATGAESSPPLSAVPSQPEQPQPAVQVLGTSLVRQASLQPQLPQAGPVLSGWRFRDVARVARACGCTAIGVLRGGGSGGGDASAGVDAPPGGNLAACGAGGRRLQLAPCPDADLDLAPEDRLVVLAADPV
jgi:hypothetical protein